MRLALSLVLVLGCGDNHPAHGPDGGPHGTGDAASDGPPTTTACWDDVYTPAGSATLGTGMLGFQPLPASIELEYGTQSVAFDLPVNAHMDGLYPGDPGNILDLSNPRTRFHGYFVDTGVLANPGRCGTRIGYLPARGGGPGFEMEIGAPLVFPESYTSTDLFNRQIHIVLEIIDAAGNYATDEGTVTMLQPPGWMP
jgi:hypothetical protein